MIERNTPHTGWLPGTDPTTAVQPGASSLAQAAPPVGDGVSSKLKDVPDDVGSLIRHVNPLAIEPEETGSPGHEASVAVPLLQLPTGSEAFTIASPTLDRTSLGQAPTPGTSVQQDTTRQPSTRPDGSSSPVPTGRSRRYGAEPLFKEVLPDGAVSRADMKHRKGLTGTESGALIPEPPSAKEKIERAAHEVLEAARKAWTARKETKAARADPTLRDVLFDVRHPLHKAFMAMAVREDSGSTAQLVIDLHRFLKAPAQADSAIRNRQAVELLKRVLEDNVDSRTSTQGADLQKDHPRGTDAQTNYVPDLQHAFDELIQPFSDKFQRFCRDPAWDKYMSGKG